MLKHINTYKYRLPIGNKPSNRVFAALSVATIVVFALFWFVGYDTPYDEDANFVAPLFTNLLLVFISLVVLTAIGIVVWSVEKSLKVRGKGERVVNNIPTKKISYLSIGLTLVLLIATFAFASSDTILVNGVEYADAWGLRVADMFVNTSIILVVVAIIAIITFTALNKRK